MKDELQQIDNYFQGILTADERTAFEQHILLDAAFADEVAFYLSVRQAAKEESAAKLKERFGQLYAAHDAIKTEHRIQPLRRFWPYVAAAAAVLVIIARFALMNPGNPSDLADQYSRTHLQQLDVTMGAGDDAFKSGTIAYNNGKYQEALQQFELAMKQDASPVTALQYAGLSAYWLNQYDKSIQYFKQLESRNLYSNPALFYHAIVLMKRNAAGDQQEATRLLQQVVEKNLAGKETAEEWLRK